MTAAARTGSFRAPVVMGAALLAVLVLVALIAGGDGGESSGPALSPSSTDADGTRGLVLLLRESGADLRVGAATPGRDSRVALLLNDGLDDPNHDALEAWVRDGGTLVVTDAASSFAARSFGVVTGDLTSDECDLVGLEDVEVLSVTLGVTFRVRSGEQTCFGDSRQAFVVATPIGDGTIVSIGSSELFTNDRLDEADNSVLAARLLLPSEGGSVEILDPNPPGSGATTLGDLITDRVFQAFLQLGVAFTIYALWRARRVGRPVREPQPVAIAGSQFVRAVGGLRQRTRASHAAATLLRADTRRFVGDRLGVPPTADTGTVATLTAARTGLDRDRVASALDDDPVLDDDALVRLAGQLDTIRQEVLDGRNH